MTLPVGAIPAILDGVAGIIDDVFTSDEEREKLELEHRRLDAQAMQGQLEINKVEAAHASVSVAGWRPALGWVCVLAFGVTFIPKALLLAGMWAAQVASALNGWAPGTPMPALPAYPDVGVTDIIGMLGALLGMSTLRSFDKLKHTDTKRLSAAPTEDRQ